MLCHVRIYHSVYVEYVGVWVWKYIELMFSTFESPYLQFNIKSWVPFSKCHSRWLRRCRFDNFKFTSEDIVTMTLDFYLSHYCFNSMPTEVFSFSLGFLLPLSSLHLLYYFPNLNMWIHCKWLRVAIPVS